MLFHFLILNHFFLICDYTSVYFKIALSFNMNFLCDIGELFKNIITIPSEYIAHHLIYFTSHFYFYFFQKIKA